MTVEMYDMEIRELAYEVINGKGWYWYPDNIYTKESAIEAWNNR